MSINILTTEEKKNIEMKYMNKDEDEIIQLRCANLQKIQPWIKVNYKKRKKNNYNYINKELEYKKDPYKFTEIPKDIKILIKELIKQYNIGLSTLSFKCNINYNTLNNYLNKNGLLDNLDLYIILSFFNYDLETKLTNQSIKINKIENIYSNNINLENINLKDLTLQAVDLQNIDIERI
jgi:hypothetical protein